MQTENAVAPSNAAIHPVIPLPYAWYVSGELIFELYEGGQPAQNFSIRWEHLKPITRLTTPPLSNGSDTGTERSLFSTQGGSS